MSAIAPIKPDSIIDFQLAPHTRRKPHRADGSVSYVSETASTNKDIQKSRNVNGRDFKRVQAAVGRNTLETHAKRRHKLNDLRWTTPLIGYEVYKTALNSSPNQHIVRFNEEKIVGDRAYYDNNVFRAISGLKGRYCISSSIEIHFLQTGIEPDIKTGQENAAAYFEAYANFMNLSYIRLNVYKNGALYSPLFASAPFRVYNILNDNFYYVQSLGLSGRDMITLEPHDYVDIRVSLYDIVMVAYDPIIRITGFVDLEFRDYKTRGV